MLVRRFTLTLLLALSPCALSGCERGATTNPEHAEDDTDRLTRTLLDELRAGDRDAVLALAGPALDDDLDERDVAVIARTLAWLGGVEDLARGSEEPVTGGVRRDYQIDFGRGALELTVTVVGGKLEGFEFDEGPWSNYVEQAAEAAAGELRVASFAFTGPGGAAIDAPVDPATINYELALEGLEAQLREHHVKVGKAVFDREGNQVYRQDVDDDVRFPQAESGSSGARITGLVAVPGPGSYELALEIHDVIGGQDMIHRVAFTIE